MKRPKSKSPGKPKSPKSGSGKGKGDKGKGEKKKMEKQGSDKKVRRVTLHVNLRTHQSSLANRPPSSLFLSGPEEGVEPHEKGW